MRSTFKVLFYTKNRSVKNGKIPVMGRDSDKCPYIRLVAMITRKCHSEKYDTALFNDLLKQTNEVKTVLGKKHQERTQESGHIVYYSDAASTEIHKIKMSGISLTNIHKSV